MDDKNSRQEPTDSKESTWAPRRKVLAAFGGAGFGGQLAIILLYHFPNMPVVVAMAYGSIIISLMSLAAGYLVRSEDD